MGSLLLSGWEVWIWPSLFGKNENSGKGQDWLLGVFASMKLVEFAT